MYQGKALLRENFEKAGRERAEKTFCWQRVAEQYAELYRKAIRSQNAADPESNRQAS